MFAYALSFLIQFGKSIKALGKHLLAVLNNKIDQSIDK